MGGCSLTSEQPPVALTVCGQPPVALTVCGQPPSTTTSLPPMVLTVGSLSSGAGGAHCGQPPVVLTVGSLRWCSLWAASSGAHCGQPPLVLTVDSLQWWIPGKWLMMLFFSVICCCFLCEKARLPQMAQPCSVAISIGGWIHPSQSEHHVSHSVYSAR
jgi:hypothetical protein